MGKGDRGSRLRARLRDGDYCVTGLGGRGLGIIFQSGKIGDDNENRKLRLMSVGEGAGLQLSECFKSETDDRVGRIVRGWSFLFKTTEISLLKSRKAVVVI